MGCFKSIQRQTQSQMANDQPQKQKKKQRNQYADTSQPNGQSNFNIRAIGSDSNLKSVPINLQYDSQASQMNSYEIKDREIKKNKYSYECIPITTDISFPDLVRTTFSFKSLGIRQCFFVAGICKKSVITTNQRTPWKTSSVICFESHQKQGESVKCGRGLKKDQIFTVGVTRNQITFQIDGKQIGKRWIPVQNFLNDSIIPYIVLFQAQDRIQLVGDLNAVRRK